MTAARAVTGILVIGVFGLGAAGCSVSAGAPVEGTFDRSLAVTGPVGLDMQSGAGRVRIYAGPLGSVHVLATIRTRAGESADTTARVRRIEANPPVEQHGNTIRIGQGVDSGLYRDLTIEYDVIVPETTSVHSVVGSGAQTIRGPLKGSIDATTGSGSIRIEDTTGDVRVATGSGSVRMTGIPGPIRAGAGRGSLRIEGQPVAGGSVRTGSGSIRMSATGAAPFEVEANTGSGGVSSDQQVTLIGDQSRHRLHGTVLGGGPPLQPGDA